MTVLLVFAVGEAFFGGACTEAGGEVNEAACSAADPAEYCYPGPASTRGIGQCADGTRSCVGGVWSACEGHTLPAAETCDDLLDNDCNGVADEGCPCEPGAVRDCYTGPAAAAGVGSCVLGQQSCVGGTWGSECAGEVLPADAEACNEIDDDCNGVVDEGCACLSGAVRDCYTGSPSTLHEGPCQQGTQSCTNGQWETSCAGEVTPAPETCNLVDDDCDGSTDEQLGTTSCGSGPCVNTVPYCQNGTVQSCEPLCDGISCTMASQCATGFCKDGRCCDTACTSPCAECGSGTCKPVTNGYDEPECSGASSCDGAGQCKKVNGESCGGAGECVSGFCKDGRCCNSSCSAACESCASGSCSTVSNADDSPECSGAYSCNAAGLCQAKSPFYTNSFEAPADFSDWLGWHNCETDSNWAVKRAQVPAPSGGAWGVRLHTTTFGPNCSFPGAYALSPAIAATAGASYRVESMCRNSSNVGQTVLIFFDAGAQQLGSASVPMTADGWKFNANPSLVATAPANTSYLQIRWGLNTPSAYADCDLLEVYLDP